MYASNTNYYAYCLFNGGNIQTLLFKCGQDEIFDTTINACRYYCKAKGNFQNPADCNQYFYCSGVAAKPAEAQMCPTNWVFDGTGCNKDAAACKFPPPAPAAADPADPAVPA